MVIKFSFFSFLFILLSTNLFATHNLAGNIIYEQTGNKTIKATIITFTNASSIAAQQRDSLLLCWGDGQCEFIERNIENIIPDNILYSKYEWTHEYADFGTYTLSMSDPNRNAGILNINFPASENIPFYLETTFVLSTEPNTSPSLLEDPVYNGAVGTPFLHIPNAFDAEGDSIAYELTTPLQDIGSPVPNYEFPPDVSGYGNLNIDEATGYIIWDSPTTEGLYVIAIKINEYRNGQLISSILRDMMIEVSPGIIGNSPPIVALSDDKIQVNAGEEVNIAVEFNDPENEDLIITATGGPFLVDPAAEFNVSTGPQQTPLLVNFTWATDVSLAREQPYQVVFTAVENNSQPKFWQNILQIKITPEPLSIKAKKEFINFDISPNPSSGEFILIFPETNFPNGQLAISNLNGKIVYENKLREIDSNNLNIPSLPKGIYFIKIENEKVIGSKKLIIK